eukprot:CAMPEP_0202879546 /NCGR_PEP_ID=MMETSP1391-20130828/33766_1 /ASSEMBLY_ACC=CAM_ASM_000867 /TAXON_ID=1034604 /ORGANISM="Chlamydomonas leiostraca, Strain SAG 11-49" /LENGTH=259 /DNA_ID=CAMNT_0049561917 /DNA_START=52 /DNA_END=831 /DNA_ORIENTATION=-
MTQGINRIGNIINGFFVIFLLVAFFSESLRRKAPGALLASIAVLHAFASASEGTREGGITIKAAGMGFLEAMSGLESIPDLGPLLNSTLVTELSSVTHVSVTPTAMVAMPVGAAAAAALFPAVGGAAAGVLATLVGGVVPYAMARAYAVWQGWNGLTATATVATGVTGAMNAWGVAWALWLVGRHARGLTVTGKPLAVSDPLHGSDPADHAFLAATATVNAMLQGVWVVVLCVRTWLCVVSCGYCCNRRPTAASKDKRE